MKVYLLIFIPLNTHGNAIFKTEFICKQLSLWSQTLVNLKISRGNYQKIIRLDAFKRLGINSSLA
jgi:hypothetical protein